jgi:hypothetical protein
MASVAGTVNTAGMQSAVIRVLRVSAAVARVATTEFIAGNAYQ